MYEIIKQILTMILLVNILIWSLRKGLHLNDAKNRKNNQSNQSGMVKFYL